MPYGLMFELPDMTSEAYGGMSQQLNEKLKTYPGFLTHIAGPDGGGFRILEVWESEEDQKRWMDEHVLPLARQFGVTVPAPRPFAVENITAR